MARQKRYDSVIVGLGLTGLSCVRHLARAGRSMAVVDSRAAPPQLPALRRDFPEVPFFGGSFDENVIAAADQVIVSPGVSPREPALRGAAAAGADIIGDIELFCRAAGAPLIAVTGSNGKSTVATLVAAMLTRAGRRTLLGGNIGTPALSLLEQPAPDYFVLELSSFQLETVRSLNAIAAAVLNISPDHMDRYRNPGEYAQAKRRIYSGSGAMILNLDDPAVREMRIGDRRQIGFTLQAPAPGQFGVIGTDRQQWIARGDEKLVPVAELHVHGAHNVANALAALALCSVTDADQAGLLQALRGFAGLPHRCQWVATRADVDWYDDSKGTNVGATCAAIAGLGQNRGLILIAGGDGKGADFSPLAEAARGRVQGAVLIGRDAPAVSAALEGIAPICFATDMNAAVLAAARMARRGEAVLLSPACASFDMFADYRQRGERFTAAVLALPAAGGGT